MKKYKKHCEKSEGMSLLDVLISVLILAMLTLATIATLTSSLDIQKRTKDLAVANEIFTQIMEDLRNIPFDDIPVPDDDSGSVTITLEHDAFTSFLGAEYVQNIRTKLNEMGVGESITLEEFGDSNLKRASVTIDYLDRKGDGYFPIKSATFIAKNGINQ